MRKRIILWGLIGLCLGLITGCRKAPNRSVSFTVDNSRYQMKLPDHWQKTKDFQEVYGETTVFGAEDQKSKAVFSIRPAGKVSEGMPLKQAWQAYQKEMDAQPDSVQTVKDQPFPTQKFQTTTVYQQQKMDLVVYWVQTKGAVLEVQLQTPQDGKQAAYQKKLLQSLTTLKETRTKKKQTDDEETLGQFENQAVSYQITGYRVWMDAQQQPKLVLRLAVENKKEANFLPADYWFKASQLEQGAQAVVPFTEKQHIDEELDYLQDKAREPLAPGTVTEIAVLYSLKQPEGWVRVVPDEKIFSHPEPANLKIEDKAGE